MLNDFQFNPTRPLDHCPGEPNAAYDALLDYYRMGSGRSLRPLLEGYRNRGGIEAGAKPPTKRFATLFNWSTVYCWQERIKAQTALDLAAEQAAKDEEMRKRAAEWVKRRMEVRERDWQQAERLRDLADKVLDEAPKFTKTTRRFIRGSDGDPDREIITIGIDAKLIIQAMETSSKLQRLAAEMETEHTLEETVPAENMEDIRAKRWEKIKDALADALQYAPPVQQTASSEPGDDDGNSDSDSEPEGTDD